MQHCCLDRRSRRYCRSKLFRWCLIRVGIVVDPVSLSIGALAVAFVVKAVEKAGENVGGGLPGAVGRVREWLSERFSRQNEDASQALKLVEAVPDSPSRLRALAELIDHQAETDSVFKTELQELIAQAQTSGVDMNAVSQIAQGIGIVQIAHTSNSTITVNQAGIPPRPAEPKSS